MNYLYKSQGRQPDEVFQRGLSESDLALLDDNLDVNAHLWVELDFGNHRAQLSDFWHFDQRGVHSDTRAPLDVAGNLRTRQGVEDLAVRRHLYFCDQALGKGLHDR